ncbi:MAG: response regulator [Gammaproteobacteria bacterium]|nr:response regulator [Gammaproteobacteria bacterium]
MSIPNKQRVLIVDDDELTLLYAEQALTEAGFDVVTATSGTQAIEIATTNDIDLALLDHRMPGIKS